MVPLVPEDVGMKVNVDFSDPSKVRVMADGAEAAVLRKSDTHYHAFFPDGQEIAYPSLAELVAKVKERIHA